MDANEWDTRYSSASSIWTRNANRTLVERCPPPGPDRRALDLGCGEGGDTRWLAGQGWDVTGVDFSAVAIERARALAAELPEPRPRYVVADATQERALRALSPDGQFALITASYLHPEPEDRTRTFGHLPRLLAPGGHLFVLSHHPDHLARVDDSSPHGHDHAGTHGRPGDHPPDGSPDGSDAGPFGPAPQRLLTPDQVLAALAVGDADGAGLGGGVGDGGGVGVGLALEVVTAEVIVRPELAGDSPGAVDSLVVVRRPVRSSPAH